MAETGAKEANATRYLFLLCLLSLTLVGCQSMGLRASDPEDLVRRYTDERSRFIEVDGVRVHTRADASVAEFRRFVSGLADDYPTHDDDAEAF